MSPKLIIAGSTLAGVLFCAVAANAATPPALYTAAQASAGATDFTQSCAVCHGADLKGGVGPALIGPAFAAPSNKYTVGSMFTNITTQMPLGQGGSLSHATYEDVMAYLLKENGYPAGGTAFDYTKGLTDPTPLVSAAP